MPVFETDLCCFGICSLVYIYLSPMFDSLCISAGWTAGALAGAGPVPQVGVVKTRHVLAWLGFLFGGSGLELVTFGV